MKTIYIGSTTEINKLQEAIMLYVDVWVHTEKTPVPQKEIVIKMKEAGIHDFTTLNALKALLKRGYIRRGFTTTNKTYYVQMRRV